MESQIAVRVHQRNGPLSCIVNLWEQGTDIPARRALQEWEWAGTMMSLDRPAGW
ncbi:MAG: hypothetical protein R3C02_00160 [Planctomycetaceae bacterium]